MLKEIKKKINKLEIEKNDNLIEFGKALKNNNVIELKKLTYYPALRSIEKNLSQMRTNLNRAEENENILKNLNKQRTNIKKKCKIIYKSYRIKLKRSVTEIINEYPKNIELLLKYKINLPKLKMKTYKTRDVLNLYETNKFWKTIIFNFKLAINSIINNINIYKLSKIFEKRILKSYILSENLENIVNEFLSNKDLSKELVDEFKLINEVQSNIKNIKQEIQKTIHMSKNEQIYKKTKIKHNINAAVKDKENILKKIAEEFIENTKRDKSLTKLNNTINLLIQKIEKINQDILNLNTDSIKITKKKEIEQITKKMQGLKKEKDKIDNKLNTFNARIKSLQNELDNK